MSILIVLPIQRSLEKRPHVDIEANSCSLFSCKCQLQLTLPDLMDCGQCIVEFFSLFNHHHASCFSPLVFLLLRLFFFPSASTFLLHSDLTSNKTAVFLISILQMLFF